MKIIFHRLKNFFLKTDLSQSIKEIFNYLLLRYIKYYKVYPQVLSGQKTGNMSKFPELTRTKPETVHPNFDFFSEKSEQELVSRQHYS